MDARFRAACEALAAGDTTGTALDVTVQDVQYFAPTPFAPELVAQVRAQAAARGYAHRTSSPARATTPSHRRRGADGHDLVP